MFLTRSTTCAAIAVLVMTAPDLGQAQMFTDAGDDEWHFAVTPYMFLPVATTGTSTVGGVSGPVDLNLKQVFENLNFAAAGRFEAWRGDFGGIVDLYYTNLGASSTVPVGGPLGSTVSVDISSRQGRAGLLGAYRLSRGTYTDEGLRYVIDLGAGVQFNMLDQDLEADLNVNIGRGATFQRKLGGTETWVEPVVMLRAATEVSEEVSFSVRADFGGFGVGGDTLQWDVVAGFDYKPWDHTSIKFGWSFYGIDYSTDRSDGKFAYDVFQTGPYVGLSFTF
ncbi:hypothetical protein KHP62_16035 [Rhodobacteraceae bacterium NNCM2]|nr:hypothetical protein [Coraliihabitans acroporae]